MNRKKFWQRRGALNIALLPIYAIYYVVTSIR